MPCFLKNKVIAKEKVFKESILNEKKKKKVTDCHKDFHHQEEISA